MAIISSSPASHSHDILFGVTFALLAAIGFSAKAILVKLAYVYHVDAVTLLALRMAFAAPIFLPDTIVFMSGNLRDHFLLEKDVVFDFSRVLAAILESRGRYRVLMTRSTDVFVPLVDRVKIGREAGAALFVSIHADILGDEPGVSGATVYTVSEKASDRQAARVAEKENQADAVAGLEVGEDGAGVNDILFDLARRETRAYSHVFARTLVGYIKDVSPLNKNPHRSAGFRVLKAPDMPSVLLELGYLSSARDVANLTAPEWRQKAADSVARSIDAFFRAQTGGPAHPAEMPLNLKRSIVNEGAGHVAGGKH